MEFKTQKSDFKGLVDSTDFQAGQIVCLEHEDTCLYAEVIQLSTLRQRCWVRPLILVVPTTQSGEIGCGDEATYNLRQGVDLLLPVTLFRVALDTEVFPLLAQLESQDPKPEVQIAWVARHQLNQFIQQVWQACPSDF